MRTLTALDILPAETTTPTFWLEKHFVTIGAIDFAADAMLEYVRGMYADSREVCGRGAEVSRKIDGARGALRGLIRRFLGQDSKRMRLNSRYARHRVDTGLLLN